MTTFTVNGIDQNTIQSHDIGQDLVAALVVDQPNAIVNVNGIGNVVLLEGTDDSIVRLNGINNEGVDFGSHTMTFLNGNGNIAVPLGDDNFISVVGVNNIVRAEGSAVAEDHGLGTIFQIEEGSHLTIKDFQNDPTGIIDLNPPGGPRVATPAQALAAEQSDGHGGTMLSLPGPRSTSRATRTSPSATLPEEAGCLKGGTSWKTTTPVRRPELACPASC